MIIIPFKEYHAARISDPDQYDSIVTKDLGDGIQLLLGFKKEDGEEKTFTQSYYFDKEKWKPKDVRKWLKEHNETPIELEMAKKETEVKEDASGLSTSTENTMGIDNITADNEIKQDGSIVTHKGDVIQEHVPIDRVPEKLFGNVRQQDVPEIAKSVIDKSVVIGAVYDDEVLSEKPEPEGVSEDYDEEEQEHTEMEEEDSWDPEQSKTNMMDWAKGKDGKISKKSLMKWYLDVDAGNGQDPNAYRYPVGAVVNGKPYYCRKALDHSWNLASGNQTGIANRNIQKKIIFLKNREDMPLTEDQMDFTERHMSAGKVTYHTLENDNVPGGIEFIEQTELKMNSSPAGSKIIYEDDQVIDVPVVPMREGVFTGTDGIPTLKKFEYFGKDAHWLEGQPILKGHTSPTELVTYKHNRIGKLMNVIARPDKKDVVAVARYYKEKLTPEDLTRIKSGTPYDGSIAYTTHTSMTPGELNGTKYNAVEDGGYHFYHFAELANGIGACSTKDGCGFMLNESKPQEMSLNENYWTAPVQSHLKILNEQLLNLQKQFKTTKEPSLEIDIKNLEDDISKWQKQLSKLNPKYNSKGSDSIKAYYNDKRRAEIIKTEKDDFQVKLNSTTGGEGLLDASTLESATDLAKLYVKSGLIPISMKLNYNCPDSEKSGSGKGSCGGSSSSKEKEESSNKISEPSVPKGTTIPEENIKSVTHLGKDIDLEDFGSSIAISSRNHDKSAEVIPGKNGLSTSIRDETGRMVTYTQAQFGKNHKDVALLNAKNYVARGKGRLSDPEEGLSPSYAMQLRSKMKKLRKESKQNSQFSKLTGNNMTEEFIQADDTEVVDVQKMNEAFEQKLNERDAKIAELTAQVEDLVQKQNAAEQALIDAKAQADFEAFSLKLNAKAREDAKTHYEGFKSDGWTYFDTNPGLLRAETPKMNARGQPAAEGDNGSNLQAARDMLKKNQKELFGKRSH